MKHKPQLINVVALAVMLTCSTMAGAAENERSTFGLSLPQVNDSAIGYGKSIDGAISDKLFLHHGRRVSDISAGDPEQHEEARGGYWLEQQPDVRQL